MSNQPQWNRGFEDPYKNQEYLESIKTRFDEFNDKTNEELVNILNENQEYNKYQDKGDELHDKINTNAWGEIPNWTRIAMKSRSAIWWGINIPAKTSHLKMNENWKREEAESPTGAIENQSNSKKLPNSNSIPNWTLVKIKSRGLIPSTELLLKMNQNWEREEKKRPQEDLKRQDNPDTIQTFNIPNH